MLTSLLLSLAPIQDVALHEIPDPIHAAVEAVSAERIRARIDTLAGFGTRHTASRTDSDTEGIGAARRWIEADLRASAAATGGRLEVRTQRFTVPLSPGRGEPRREVELVNVYGFLPGAQDDPLGRTFVVSGHYDSINGDSRDAEGPAPGADDDASGTAVVMELARVLSTHEFDANVVFLCVPGEEQGLHGAEHFAAWSAEQGVAIAGMFTNDIVGGSFDAEFEQDHGSVRLFAGGDAPDAPSRELARAVDEGAAAYVPGFDVRLIFHLDRNGRGGDHIPFHERGWPAARFTEARENYRRQHKDISEDGRYGDLPEYVSAEYTADVARTNAAALMRLASAPPPPQRVRLRAAMRESASLSWREVPDAAGYEVVWRETTSAVWQHALRVEDTSATLEGVVGDDWYFGVRSLDEHGHASLAGVPRRR